MQLFVLHPNLEISSCDGGPSEKTIEGKKLAYLKNLKRYNDLMHKLSENPSVKEIPDWCFTRDTERNISEVIKRNTSSNTQSHSNIKSNHINDVDQKPVKQKLQLDNKGKCEFAMNREKLEEINTVEDLPIETIRLNDEDQLPFKKNKGDKNSDGSLIIYMLQRINLPKKAKEGQNYRVFLVVKYLEISTDVLLVEYKYIQVYSRMNEIIRKYFSKPELTPEMEEEGFKQVNKEMDFFKKLENILVRLRRLKAEFKDTYGTSILDFSESEAAGINDGDRITTKPTTTVGK
ncbi:hypothetical protein BRETT_003239 [Brettanomyces bruxellensis]|uniref:Uncharacterized protein n=1 Tax=Dekkera bruxellensis TaxID=5007 RepID=A0A871RH29_DEKBR|nr:uncharacterized protein BRETT_003239 [Brettanomyces bruxellensis]QOU23048.1 hypothetical protein BRETT_003239 [Brettanomyces bruxellensis]